MSELERARKAWATWTEAEAYPEGDWSELLATAEEFAHALIVALEQRVQEAEAEAKRWRGRHVKAVELLEQAEARAEELRRQRDRLRHRELARHGDWCEGCRRYATIETQIRRGWVTDGEGVHLCPFCQDDAAHTEEAGDDVG